MRKFKMNKATVIRTIVLIVALLNQFLVSFGLSPFPFSQAEIEAGLAMVFSAAATFWAWWKNNDVTPEAHRATAHMNALKKKNRKGGDN